MHYHNGNSSSHFESSNTHEDFYLNTNFESQVKSSKFNCTLTQLQEEAKKNEFIRLDLNGENTKIKTYKDCSLNESEDQAFNQFETNEKLFKTNSTYSNSVYNPDVEYDSVPENLKSLAEKIEKEVKSRKSTNNHINEERGLSNNASDSEEAKYSSVVRASTAKQLNQEFVNKSKLKSFVKNLFIILTIVFVAFISYRVNKIYRRSNIDLKRPYEFTTMNSYTEEMTVN